LIADKYFGSTFCLFELADWQQAK
jgi:hypothetical protein